MTANAIPVDTGTTDPDYNLILVLQQALEDCHRYAHFAQDARDHDDSELATLFDELSDNDRQLGLRLKQLLATRLASTAARG